MPLFILLIALLCYSPLQAREFTPQGDVIGKTTTYTVQQKDNLYDIARRFDVGIVELLAANPGTDAWKPQEGKELTLPTSHLLPRAPHRGIVINLSALRLFYYQDATHVLRFPIGIGREGWETPLGTATVIRKQKNPIWTPPASIRAENPELPAQILPGPDDPLGDYALYLGWHGVLIHGTNRPYGIGRRSSHGCIRLYPEDIATLFPLIKMGTPVTVVDQPYELGWQGNNLMLEVLPTQMQSDFIAAYLQLAPQDDPEIRDAVKAADGPGIKIDWDAVTDAIQHRNGIPVVIGTK